MEKQINIANENMTENFTIQGSPWNSSSMFFAHSENESGKRHKLSEHLLATADMMKSFAPQKDLEKLFYFSGLLHDIGKFQDGFQKYLREGKPKTPHAAIGAYIVRILARQHIPSAFAIKGHHAGMPNKQELISDLQYYKENQKVVHQVYDRFNENFPDVNLDQNSVPTDFLIVECLTRILFSALTDADWLDTEHHFKPLLSEARECSSLDYNNLLHLLKNKIERLSGSGTINDLRTKARIETARKAQTMPGCFSLQLPTGLGKTLTSVYWALLHARHHNLKRIIIVLPYVNIIDQTALILKEIFGTEKVLEHHSGIVEEEQNRTKDNEESIEAIDINQRLACENWDFPIIVTTTVQFFESLFSNRPFKCRKNHNIAQSIVIFDEIQTLPKEYIEPITVMLNNFNSLSNTSFLFCTATQPALEKREGFNGIEKISPLIERPEEYFNITRRVTYELLNELNDISIDTLTETLAQEKESYLVIVNTKSIAQNLFHRINNSGTHDGYYHLSTAMCPHHRKRWIREIIDLLHMGKRIAVISTQLVEAGVDFDFPCVFRAIAPLDSIIQAAGRCNRNGNLNGMGRVILFNLENQKMPDSTYDACSKLAKGIILRDPESLYRHDSFERYYEQVTALFVNTDKYGIMQKRRDFNFRMVAEGFRLINEPTTSLFIKDYCCESENLLGHLLESWHKPGALRDKFRIAQQFSVQVYPNYLRSHNEYIEIIENTLRIWHGKYDDDLGLATNDMTTVF